MPTKDCLEPIAIVGVGGIFPGAKDLEAFWKNIANGVDSGRHVPPGRWFLSPETAFDPDGPKADRVYSTWGCFIENFLFDPARLNLDATFIDRLDPLFHLGLHAARSAYDDAGRLGQTDHGRVGVILGNIALPTESTSALCRNVLGRTYIERMLDGVSQSSVTREALNATLHGDSSRTIWHPRNRFAASFPAAVIAQGLRLGGLAFTLDAACASSLYALKFACEELRANRADAMLAGGMSRPDCQYTQMGFAQLKALSRQGRCAPLSAAADGLVVGEGAGVFVLKRLSDAIAASDRIYGVIAGIGLSNDRGANLLAPHSEGQLRAMRLAYDEAGWRPSDVDLIECHATGTPVGDSVEISSLHQLWQNEQWATGQCVIGGVKSNVGHLLTGAGAAGLMKVIYALKYQTLPPTANFTKPAAALDERSSPFRVLAQAEPWQRRGGSARDDFQITEANLIPRRATVNAFGFGGINAHVLIEEYCGVPQPVADTLARRPVVLTANPSRPISEPRLPTARSLDIAVIGLATHVGSTRSSSSASRSSNDEQWFESTMSNDWGVTDTDWYRSEFEARLQTVRSTYNAIAEVRLPLGEFRIPPLEMQDMLPQQQLMLRVAAEALRNSVRTRRPNAHSVQGNSGQLPAAHSDPIEVGNRTGVFVGIELDPNTTNFHLRWSVEELAPSWAKTLGLELSPLQMKQWIDALKNSVSPSLTANRVMGNLGGIVASRLAREFNVGGPSFTISSDENSGLRACELAAHALRRGELDRALVGAVDLPCDIRSKVADLHDTSRDKERSICDGATAIVLKRWEDAIRDGDQIHAVIRAIPVPTIRNAVQENTKGLSMSRDALAPGLFDGADRVLTHPGSPEVSSCFSQSAAGIGAATGLVHLVNSVVSLSEKTTLEPPLRHWLRNRFDGPRRIHVKGFGFDGRSLVFEISEPDTCDEIHRRVAVGVPQDAVDHRPRIESFPSHLFAIDGDSDEELTSGLGQLADLTELQSSLVRLAQLWFRKRPLRPEQRWAIVLVAKTLQELKELIETGFHRLKSNSSTSNLDRRIQFVRQPAGREGRVAFVFPGSGNAFLGMGRDLLAAFPEVLIRQDAENQRLRDQYRPDLVWDGDSTAALLEDHKAMIFSQVALGTAICDLLARFNVRPSASIGYSLGESAAFFGLRAWTDRDGMLERMHDATLFGSDLVRPFNAARRAWNVPGNGDVDWVSGVIDRSAADIRTAMGLVEPRYRRENAARSDVSASQVALDLRYPRVYLLIINTPSQCVIGGLREQVERLVSELSARFVPLAAPSTVHCEVLHQVVPAYRALHLMPTTTPVAPNRIDFYSTAWGQAYELTRESAAEAIVAQAVATIDFPRVVTQAYSDGVRVFLEIGPGSSCTRMIDDILEGQPYLAQSATPATANPIGAFLELIALLIAERVPVDLSYLYGGSDEHNEKGQIKPAHEVVTRTGRPAFQIPVPDGGWPVPTLVSNGEESPDIDLRSSMNLQESNVMNQLEEMLAARAKAHEAYLRFSSEAQRLVAEQVELLHHMLTEASPHDISFTPPPVPAPNPLSMASVTALLMSPPRSLTREQCMEFAIGRIGNALGGTFAEIDRQPTRVRLPDEPLMLVDRILDIEGEPLSMTSGCVVTEHDILPAAWYLDCNRIPTCIAVEAGQADLFLSGWLGIDFETKGLACYRLLDAVVTFHDQLPQPGKVIHYNIRINHFFRQGQTYLFRFEFDSTVDGKPLLTMREGCAGFFTEAELAGGKGIVHTALDRQPRPGKKPSDWSDLVPVSVESYDDAQLLCLRQGNLSACFGVAFSRLSITNPVTLPGLVPGSVSTGHSAAKAYVGSQLASSQRSRMWLIDRVLKLDPTGGKFGIGMILGELDIHPDDWFITCHFCDDQVMPGTLMYECCLHTLRVYLLRMGWIGEQGQVVYEPVPEIRSRLKCRGQVRANTKKVWYEITLKEIGYAGPSNETPYCLADALMYADGKPIVEITDMSVRLSGLTRKKLEQLWNNQTAFDGDAPQTDVTPSPPAITAALRPPEIRYDRRPALFDTERITAFAIGNPSEAFGDRYRVFDSERTIARLPGPPFQFLDRIVAIDGCEPWKLQAGGQVVAQYDVPLDAWYFQSNRQSRMPFAVLLETALQPCGWLAAYVGSALTSDTDLSFRNLGGTATQLRDVIPESGTLTTTVKMTRVSHSGGMIIQHYDFDLRCEGQPAYAGNTYFGFFSKASLENQIGIRDAKPFVPSADDLRVANQFQYIDAAPFADSRFQMIDDVQLSLRGGPAGLGFAIGTTLVDPTAWFFKAHFHQDPVVPGSLGLESFFQLLKFYAAGRWQLEPGSQFATPIIHPKNPSIKPKHEWVYRGQVIPRDKLVTVSAVISQIDDATRELVADGFLSVDGRVIYQMKEFSLGVC